MLNGLKLLSLNLCFLSLLACQGNDSVKVPVHKVTDTVVKSDSVPEVKDTLPQLSYSFVGKKEWQGLKDSFEGAQHLDKLIAINRVDSAHIKRLDSILVPNTYALALHEYLPFPAEVPFLSDVDKIIIFSNPTQTFAAYESGKLVRVGQTNMGKKATPTPPKLYYCNWKSKRTVSTVNKSWILNWNFNVSNFGGIGFHEYGLPGYPASHSCMRLQEADAYFLYQWAEQWIMKDNAVQAKGTPVLVDSVYPFGSPRPWFALAEHAKALDISPAHIESLLAEHKAEILANQEKRKTLLTAAL